jgi:hypothetical protein
MSDNPITVELLSRTVLGMKRLPDFQGVGLEALVETAHQFLVKCALVVEHHANTYTQIPYRDGIAAVTSFNRIREREIAIFKEFYFDVYFDDDPIGERWDYWQKSGLISARFCQESALKFGPWNARRLSKIAEAKNNLKKLVAHPSRTKKTTCEPRKTA